MRALQTSAPATVWWDAVGQVLQGTSDRPVRPVPEGAGARPPGPREDDLLTGAAVVIATSGSTGRPKEVVLDAVALRASATATLDRLGGPGQWLQTLSPATIAGWQVWVRSVLADVPPVLLPVGAPFTVEAFVRAAAQMRVGARRYTAVVPTQLHRLLADTAGSAALAGFDAVLVGGAALPEPLRARAHRDGVRLVTTYGMTETSGGALYDGVPLAGVTAATDEDGLMRLSGPVLARGYLGDTRLSTRSFVRLDGRRWFRTADLAERVGDTWRVVGRIDDVINTGGHKVLPQVVEQALLELPGVTEALVVGLPDPEWGHQVAALVVTTDQAPAGATGDPTTGLRSRLRDLLPPHALPRRILLVSALPLLPGGKVDRAVATTWLSGGSGTL